MDITYWQIVAFCGPVAATLLVWSVDLFTGQKTTINATLSSLTAGLELVDFSWLPEPVASSLLAGFAVSALLSNTVLTSRKAEQ